MKIYTLTGDDGTTSLSGGRRIPKHSLRVEAYGSVDELIAWLGLLRDHQQNAKRRELLIYIQDQLMRCTAALAYDSEKTDIKRILPDTGCISVIENEIDRMEKTLPPLNNFILPGGNILVSYCHVTRCVCRRAERAVLRSNEGEKSPQIVNKFLNRLSDYLFVLSRIISLELGAEEVKWTV
ncbi:MAG TPA: cob(I)yrinic acid a,c-diamide adenosyltransferase [Bacteroidales bacterium]|nr:cob(I)yrinic acid a,c-diamide adenosyltransferase [Bacteroidales bacterium]HUX57403.1 cob(I)yrinic acid a,c-diamide adenosyltransferase [Bacteroidales bacterium]